MLNIRKTQENHTLTVALAGRLDTLSSPQLDAAVRESLGDVDLLTLDLSELTYISSAGLRVLLSLQRAMNRQGEMRICHANELVTEIFEVTGFSELLNIE